jgi:hypothetical protein
LSISLPFAHLSAAGTPIEINGPPALFGHDLREIQRETAQIIEQKCELLGHDSASSRGRCLVAELLDAQGAEESELSVKDDDALHSINQGP